MDLLGFILYLLLTITLLQALHLIRRLSKPRSKVPPGPAPLPVIGNILKQSDKPHKSLAELSKTHGPIMSLKLGQITAVVISYSALAKEILQKKDLAFSFRTIPDAVQACGHHKYSVIWLPVSDRWRSLRKIMAANMFSGSILDANQNLRREKVKELNTYVEKCCEDGVAVDIGRAAFHRAQFRYRSSATLGDKPHQSMAEQAKTHGQLIMNLKLAQITAVVISSSAVAKEVLQKHDLPFSFKTIPNAAQLAQACVQHKYSVN